VVAVPRSICTLTRFRFARSGCFVTTRLVFPFFPRPRSLRARYSADFKGKMINTRLRLMKELVTPVMEKQSAIRTLSSRLSTRSLPRIGKGGSECCLDDVVAGKDAGNQT